jgi:uncharacterized protein YqgC (DUF456 family)
MTDVLAVLLLALCVLTGLALVPVGLPGLWLMVVGLIAYGWLTEFRSVGAPVVAIVVALALVGEVLETWLGFRFARRHGGSSRSGFGALLGGLVGAIVGVPVPIVGSVIGAFIGAFVGAALAEYTLTRRTQVAASAGWGAVLGRAAAAAVKIGLGLAIGIVSLVAVLRG